MYSGYIDEEDTEVLGDSLRNETPAVFKCITFACKDYLNEYFVGNADPKACPTCKKDGTWIHRFVGKKPERQVCGMCKRVVIISEHEWVIGHYGWGFLQLSNRHKYKVICIPCAEKLRREYPGLAEDDAVKTEVLPKIVQPSLTHTYD